MEKYCPNCGKVLGEVDFRICPYCGTTLKIRVGRQPIPSKLRHAVFQRDNYRCVECGATNKETTLEIDHIIPVAKGGTNDINNLQTLCKECNRAKSATIWQTEPNVQIIEDQLNHLKNNRYHLQQKLEQTDDEEEKIDYKFKILKLDEKINPLKERFDKLVIEEQKKINEQKRKEEILKRKNTLFKKLYVELTDEELLFYTHYFSIPTHYTKDDKIGFIVNYRSAEQIESAKKDINKRLEYSKEIYDELDSLVLKKLYESFDIPAVFLSPHEKMDYLCIKLGEEKLNRKISSVKEDIKMCEKFCNNLSSEWLSKLYSEFSSTNFFTLDEDKREFLIKNYSFKRISTKYEFLVNRENEKNAMYNELCDFEDEFLERFFDKFDIPNECKTKDQKLDYILDNYKIENISNKKIKLIEKINEEKEREKAIRYMYTDLYNNYEDIELNKLFRHFQISEECKTKEEKLDFILKTYYPHNVRNMIQRYPIKRKHSSYKKNLGNETYSDNNLKINEVYGKNKKFDFNWDDTILLRLSNYFSIPDEFSTKEQKKEYLENTYSESYIRNAFLKVKDNPLYDDELFSKLDGENFEKLLNWLLVPPSIFSKRDQLEYLNNKYYDYEIKHFLTIIDSNICDNGISFRRKIRK